MREVSLNSVNGTTPAVSFVDFIADAGVRLRRALVARYGVELGVEACAEATAWAWANRERLLAMANPVGYLFRVGQTAVRTQTRWQHAPLYPAEPGPVGTAGARHRPRRCARRADTGPADGVDPRPRPRLPLRRGGRAARHSGVDAEEPPPPRRQTASTTLGAHIVNPELEARLRRLGASVDAAAEAAEARRASDPGRWPHAAADVSDLDPVDVPPWRQPRFYRVLAVAAAAVAVAVGVSVVVARTSSPDEADNIASSNPSSPSNRPQRTARRRDRADVDAPAANHGCGAVHVDLDEHSSDHSRGVAEHRLPVVP